MLDRVCLGRVPRKHHSVLRDEDGKLLYEHCLTRQGFDGAYSILYHRTPPQRDVGRRASELPPDPPVSQAQRITRRHLVSTQLLSQMGSGDHLATRRLLLANSQVGVGLCRPLAKGERYFANGDGDELYFVHAGAGTLETMFGPLRYGPGDYLLIPRGTIYRVVPDAADKSGEPLWLYFEGKSYVEIPKNFRNPWGQLRMDAPYSHRDFRHPERLPEPAAGDADGRYTVVVKRGGHYHELIKDSDPLDVVGWDGSVYPVAFSIHDYQAKVGRVHLPPTTFSTFVGGGFIVCSFVPRLLDYDAEAIPCPYPHSSVDCDELIFYVSGNFTSRRGIGATSLSFHPIGTPHGPQPGAYEASIGKQRTDEIAVMLDTFEPLGLTAYALAIDDPGYEDSWRR